MYFANSFNAERFVHFEKKKYPSLLEDINKGDPMFSAMQFGALCDWLM